MAELIHSLESLEARFKDVCKRQIINKKYINDKTAVEYTVKGYDKNRRFMLSRYMKINAVNYVINNYKKFDEEQDALESFINKIKGAIKDPYKIKRKGKYYKLQLHYKQNGRDYAVFLTYRGSKLVKTVVETFTYADIDHLEVDGYYVRKVRKGYIVSIKEKIPYKDLINKVEDLLNKYSL